MSILDDDITLRNSGFHVEKSREYKGKDYQKHWIVIPQKIIDKLGWKTGQDLEAEIEGKKLIIEKD